MRTDLGNIAIAEPPVQTVAVVIASETVREPVLLSDLAILRERVKRIRLPRGECILSLPA